MMNPPCMFRVNDDEPTLLACAAPLGGAAGGLQPKQICETRTTERGMLAAVPAKLHPRYRH